MDKVILSLSVDKKYILTYNHIKMSVDFNALSQQFCTFYYDQFDKDRSQLGNLYVRMKI